MNISKTCVRFWSLKKTAAAVEDPERRWESIVPRRFCRAEREGAVRPPSCPADRRAGCVACEVLGTTDVPRLARRGGAPCDETPVAFQRHSEEAYGNAVHNLWTMLHV